MGGGAIITAALSLSRNLQKVVAAKKANGATDEEVATFKAAANAGAKIVLSTWKERGYQL